MSKQVVQKWRESASLIILAKNQKQSVSSNYKVLLLRRSRKASFMPSSLVFPGGVWETDDESRLWVQYFQQFGIKKQNLLDLTRFKTGPDLEDSKINVEDRLEKHLSLKITAIRETFEEVGVLLCRSKKQLCDPRAYGNFEEDFDRLHWQHIIHNDASQFLTLCKELEVIPDLWRLHEWSSWLTPAWEHKRFRTSFFTVALENIPSVIVEKSESTDHSWKSPVEYLKSYRNKEVLLPPPQFYELSRLLNFSNLDDLIRFSEKRVPRGMLLMLPVLFKCLDGYVSLLPGDGLYPNDPEVKEVVQTGVTMEEFRAKVERLHRTEFVDDTINSLHLNFKLSDGHLSPINCNS